MVFFLPCVPPKTNHQAKRIVRVGKWTRLADKPELEAAKGMLDELLLPHQPASPFVGPVQLALSYCWPWLAADPKRIRAYGRVPHWSRPDADNLAKTLTDRLVALRFIEDDGQVARLIVEKWRGDQPGITVRIFGVRQDRGAA